jgi:DNA-binding MarR family transcriptional regulator
MALDRLETALAVLGAIDPGALPLHQARILVFLGQVPTATYAELGDHLNLSGASISRSLHTLEVKHQMVEVFRDPREGRRYQVRLSRKGRALIASVSGLMEPIGSNQPTTTHDHYAGPSEAQDQS